MSGHPAGYDEAGLVDRSRRGDVDAFNQIVAAYQHRVYNLCLRMLGSQQAAEDATQECFISAFRNLRGMRGRNLQSWLFRIASNGCIDEIRRRQRQPSLSLDVPAPGAGEERQLDVPDAAAGPEELLLRGETGAALQAELLRLPPDQRLAVILCDIEGLDYQEIAASMGTSVGTVKSRISRGRARLRDALRARPELFGDVVRQAE
jgi:RNA polymerase sigma-70 factor (ECF subfamily)